MSPLHSLSSLIFSSISFVVMSMWVSLQQAAQLNDDTKSRDLAGCERRVCVNIDQATSTSHDFNIARPATKLVYNYYRGLISLMCSCSLFHRVYLFFLYKKILSPRYIHYFYVPFFTSYIAPTFAWASKPFFLRKYLSVLK